MLEFESVERIERVTVRCRTGEVQFKRKELITAGYIIVLELPEPGTQKHGVSPMFIIRAEKRIES